VMIRRPGMPSWLRGPRPRRRLAVALRGEPDTSPAAQRGGGHGRRGREECGAGWCWREGVRDTGWFLSGRRRASGIEESGGWGGRGRLLRSVGAVASDGSPAG
jgi:hypothetical protein